MLPLRLYMENFGSFRAPTSVDLHDVEYFVLVGPTGAGKSTVIDAICFALYGTVPRWGKENVISLALAPSATSGKVALVFEASGRRYGIVRALVRNNRGTVTTREARLDELDPATDPAQGIAELLASPVRTIADGDRVTTAAQRLTGLEYRFFTQCVILPQGKFAEFLHAVPNKRQELLVQLLDAKIFDEIKQRATGEEKQAEAAAEAADTQLAKLTDADQAAEVDAQRRLDDLQALSAQVHVGLDDLRGLDGEVADLENELTSANNALAALGAVSMPEDLPTLADELRATAGQAEQLNAEVTQHEEAENRARAQLAALGDKTALELALRAHAEHRRLTTQISSARADLDVARAEAEQAERAVDQARSLLDDAEARRQHVRDTHTAADLAQRLTVGAPCPVCLRSVTELPHRELPSDLGIAEQEVRQRKADWERHDAHHRQLENRVTRLQQDLLGLERQLEDHAEHIRAHPDAEDLQRRLSAIETAEQQAQQARRDIDRARTARDAAEKRHAELSSKADGAWRALDAARDPLVPLGVPPLDRTDPHAAWTALLAWRDREEPARRGRVEALGDRLSEARQRRSSKRDALVSLLESHQVPVASSPGPDDIDRAVATARAHTESRLEHVRANRRRAQDLEDEIRMHRQQARVAHELALRLRANNFENWLCGEALELLVAVASQTLRELSDGQFELVLGDRNAIEVIDYAEAGMRRNVRTLSGGETFQASLALALALSDQVSRLSAGAAKSLDSIFLDEGFGTLDPATLDTVATTLERLATGGDRMVGIVTHVPALAERVPVRFEIIRDETGSHLEKKTT